MAPPLTLCLPLVLTPKADNIGSVAFNEVLFVKENLELACAHLATMVRLGAFIFIQHD